MNPGVGCGRCEKCLSGKDNQCRYYGIIGSEFDGGYAELVSVPRRNVVQKPERMDFVQAASVPLVFLTAYHMLVERAAVRAGETVLVLGAGSGVGVAAIQIAKAYGANVVATAGTDAKLRKAVELGADSVVNHNTQDIVQETRKYTGGRGVDVVVEHVGKATWDRSIRSVAKGGRIVTCGATTGFDAETDLRYIYSKEISVLGSFMGGAGELLSGPRALQAAEAPAGGRQRVPPERRCGGADPDGEGRALRQDRADGLALDDLVAVVDLGLGVHGRGDAAVLLHAALHGLIDVLLLEVLARLGRTSPRWR